MITLTTLAIASAMLTHPMQPEPANDAAQIDLTVRLILVKDMDQTPDREAADAEGRRAFTVPDLRHFGPKILTKPAVLDIGDGRVAFTPERQDSPIDLSGSHGRAEVISQPRVLALAGQEASISIGSQLTVVESSTGPDDEGFFLVKFAERMEGVELVFVGSESPAGVRIDPLEITITTVSGPSRSIALVDGHLESPTLSQRRLESSITVPAGSLAIVPIGVMPDDSGFLIAAISAKVIDGSKAGATPAKRR